MNYFITESKVVIEVDNHRLEFLKENFSNEILNEEILSKLSFNDLLEIWHNLYGIPKNVKKILLKKIELYSSSNSINSFVYNNKEYWLDKNHRSCLQNLSGSTVGDIELILDNEILTINALKLKAFLTKLETYAYKCYVNTFKHLENAKKLVKTEDILNYDYTTGYPEKITLE